MTYQVQKQDSQIILVEKRNDDIPPVIFDTTTEDQAILEGLIGDELNKDDFKVDELPIEGYPNQFHTVAKLLIDDSVRSKIS